MCAHGMFIKGKPALKATGWLSNSEHILEQVAKQCSNLVEGTKHEHADLQHGAAAAAAIYPEKLCLAILAGLRKQLEKDKVMFEGEIGTVCEDPIEKAFQNQLHDAYFIDDVSGKVLDTHMVQKARADEK